MMDDVRTILLVEDESLIAIDEQKELAGEGFEVFIENSGLKALEFIRARKGRLDLILMDIHLGKGMDGTEAAEAILREFDIPILFLTAYSDRGTIERTRNISSYGYVVKTTGIAVLSASIRTAIRLHKAGFSSPAGADGGSGEAPVSPAGLKAALESAADAILIVARDGTISGFNSHFARMWRIPEKVMAEKNNEKAVAAVLDQLKDPEGFLKKIRVLNSRPDEESFDELEFRDGRVFERYSRPQYIDGKSVGRVSSFRDVTERRQAAEALRKSEENYRLISSLTTDYFFRMRIGEDGRPVMDMISPNFTEITGRAVGEAATPDLWANFIHPDDLGLLKTQLGRLLSEGGKTEIECRSAVRGGPMRWVHVAARAVRAPEGDRTIAIVGGVKDVTERRSAEEELNKALRQKDVLMKEMRHRIKNSLAVVSGLLTLETEHMDDPECREILDNTRTRIRSIASIYDLLNKSTDPHMVDLKAIVLYLAGALLNSHSSPARRFVLKSSLEEVRLDTQRAFPLGLILNELITNVLKHAYPGNGGGEVRIDLRKSEGKIFLRVEDDGKGLPAGVDPKTAETTGLGLIRILADEIDASWSYSFNRGTRVSLEIPE